MHAVLAQPCKPLQAQSLRDFQHSADVTPQLSGLQEVGTQHMHEEGDIQIRERADNATTFIIALITE
jgi:hypothetical protein